MFEIAETGASIDKAEYDARVPELRVDLVNAQYDLRSAHFPVIIVIDGDDWMGIQRVLIGFSDWMDGRYIQFNAMEDASEGDRRRPLLQRFWSRLPGQGELAIFANAWTVGAVRDHVRGEIDEPGFERRLRQIRRFEEDQANDGALILKFWLHLPKKEMKKVLKKARKGKNGSANQFIPPEVELTFERYDEILAASARLIEVTDEATSPWHVVESSDPRHAEIVVGETVLAALRGRLEGPAPTPAVVPAAAPSRAPSILAQVDLGQKLERETYKRRLSELQASLHELTSKAHAAGIASVVVLEGWDAAGKGGVIRRVMRGADLRRARVVPIAAPTDEELAHHYLWRFWRKLPGPGELVIFDRSWYGRVLVERVEGLAAHGEWRRAYSEINHFEEQLTDAGVIVRKFWLHIDPDEQLARFEARERTAYKKYKITDEDYRNREKWADYEAAIDEMVKRTSTTQAPWQLVSANDKPWARVRVLEELCDALSERL